MIDSEYGLSFWLFSLSFSSFSFLLRNEAFLLLSISDFDTKDDLEGASFPNNAAIFTFSLYLSTAVRP